MPTLLEHVREQGQIPFAERPFDALDSLALTQIVYMPMEGLADGGAAATVAQLWAHLTAAYPNAFSDPFQRKRYHFTGACAQAARYAGLAVTGFVNHVDAAQETQFCAATFHLPDGARYVAYRGTDLTLAGWKEDLNMSFQPVPAQAEATAYMDTACGGGPLLAGGHSKGGHLALYAAAHAAPQTQASLARVYSFDGPGVDEATLTGDSYARVSPLVESYIPQSSVVGMLLCYHPVFTVVRSSAIGLLQHDALTWQVHGGAFETVEGLDLGTRVTDEALRQWIDRLTADDRRFLSDTVFRIISTLDGETVDPLVQNLPGSTVKLFSAFRRLEPDTRARARRILGELFTSGASETVRLLLPSTFRRFAETPAAHGAQSAAPAQPGAASDTAASPAPQA